MSADPQSGPLVFVDTNILVYAYDTSAGKKHTLALKVIKDCWENENGCLSIQVLQEFFVNVTRKIPLPLNIQTARQIVADLAFWQVHSPEAMDVLHAIDLGQDYQLSFWDAMIVQSASHLGCAKLFSEDLNPGQSYGDVQIINPFTGVD